VKLGGIDGFETATDLLFSAFSPVAGSGCFGTLMTGHSILVAAAQA
jgi:hypothetical protein